MKVHKLTVYVIDFDHLGAEAVKETLENQRFPNDCIDPRVLSMETRDIGEWSDDHPLNHTGKAPAEYERIFAK